MGVATTSTEPRDTPADGIVSYSVRSRHLDPPRAPARGARIGVRPAGPARGTPPVTAIIAVGLAAVIAGARSFTAIGEWVADATDATLRELGVTGTARPEESTNPPAVRPPRRRRAG